jgi:tRNA threonylcarbamoyladenosine biosynthesis protein TsaB
MLLAIDSSSVTAAAALLRDGVLAEDSFLNNGLTHSHTLAPLIMETLQNAGVRPEEVRQVVVTNGPGSFTGLRIGVATALGFSAALGIPCAGVSSLMAAAYGSLDWKGTICAAMDARRGQIYCAMFESDGSALRRLTEDEAMDRDAFIKKVPPPVLWVGDAAGQCRREGDFAASRPYVSGLGTALCFINGHSRPADKIVYLRMPQAERERLERINQPPARPAG